ncbi:MULTISPECIES: nucleoside triphosphate pyrophosphatase [unclassified Corynebacterium]|uniref:nucleoside triphosphate pyrophosphatase n=1 Tax=unclassified Corynebacterium TaxID=2624378 RepID=UPI0030ABD00E
MNRVILASSSPSRLMVLRGGGIEPEVIKPDVDEDAILAQCADASTVHTVAESFESAKSAVCALAEAKAAAVVSGLAACTQETVVIACDSMLLLDGHLTGKPHTESETIRRWEAQRGRAAELVTGHCIVRLSPEGGSTGAQSGAPSLASGQKTAVGITAQHTEAVSTTVRFGQACDADIAAYARTGEPFGCAGAFTLEALGGWFIDSIDGDPSSVLGLSLPLIRRVVNMWDMPISSFWNR